MMTRAKVLFQKQTYQKISGNEPDNRCLVFSCGKFKILLPNQIIIPTFEGNVTTRLWVNLHYILPISVRVKFGYLRVVY